MPSLKDGEKPDRFSQTRTEKRAERESGSLSASLGTRPVDRINESAPATVEFENDEGIGAVFGGQTGEADRDVVAGGWAGTDDATSTAPSDLAGDEARVHRAIEDEPDGIIGRGSAGGLYSEEGGGITDLTGSPVEESRDWSTDAIVEKE